MALAVNHNGILVLIMDEENLERIKNFDPFEFDSSALPDPLVISIPFRMIVAYAPKEDYAKIVAMREFPDALVKYLTKGWKLTESDKQRKTPYEKL